MTKPTSTSRREFLNLAAAFGASGLAPGRTFAQQRMPRRAIPGTGDAIPVIGLGSSKAVSQIATAGSEPLRAVLQTLVAHGGSVVDTWPRDPGNDAAFGRVVNEPHLRDELFIATKIDRVGRAEGLQQFRETQRLYGRKTLDLVQIFSLTDLDTHWPMLEELQASGEARYIGVTVSSEELYPRLERFLRRERPDFMQVNYSVTERRAEERLLPLARERGVAVLANRPFMNGDYFRKLAGRELPAWVTDLGCESWAQYSLMYILGHPAITGVLTETTNPRHMAENARAAFERQPDAAVRRKMVAYLQEG